MVREIPAMPPSERRDDERYQRLMAATRRAARAGYDSVSMRDLAQATRMSMTTIYQYCSSKDHLIAEAHFEWMERVSTSLPSHPPRGRSAQSRLLRYVGDVTTAWEENEVLMRTLQRALYSLEAGVSEVRASLHGTFTVIMDVMIGNEEIPHRASAIEIIGHVLDSVTYRWIAGTIDAAEARLILQRTVRTVIPK